VLLIKVREQQEVDQVLQPIRSTTNGGLGSSYEEALVAVGRSEEEEGGEESRKEGRRREEKGRGEEERIRGGEQEESEWIEDWRVE
jgi:hypothetical protein